MRTQGLDVFRGMLPGLIPDHMTSIRDGGFADELGELSIEHVFGALWTRPARHPLLRPYRNRCRRSIGTPMAPLNQTFHAVAAD